MTDKTKEPEPVSEFLREHIARWQASGRTLKSLGAAAGLAPSMISQIKLRTSDAGLATAAKLAGPFGYADLADLVNAALVWWRSSDRRELPGSSAEAPRAEAIRIAHAYGVSDWQIDRVAARYPSPDFDHKDALWWLSRFHEERSLDAEREAALRAADYDLRIAERAQADYQASVRRQREARTVPRSTKSNAKAG